MRDRVTAVALFSFLGQRLPNIIFPGSAGKVFLSDVPIVRI